jgi:hypothetical protein
MDEFYYRVESRESRLESSLRSFEQEWREEIETIREQLVKLRMSTDKLDFILDLLPKEENPEARVGKIEWI